MPEYRVTIRPMSPFETPLHSDTIFGHICWALRYQEGEESLRLFLDKLKQDHSIFLLSSAFPEGYIPCPLLRPMTMKEDDDFRERFFSGKPIYEATTKTKSFSKIRWISEKLFDDVKDHLSTFYLYERMLQEKGEPAFQKTIEEWHNSINRLSGRVIEGNLFTQEVTFYNTNLVVLVRESYFGKNRLYKLFEFIGKNGFGADASNGRGFFSCNIEEKPILGSINPNAATLLSHTTPSSSDPKEGYYRVLTKFGKVGGTFAVRGLFFKRPTLIIEPGATFMNPLKPYYGRIIGNVHSTYKEIVHYGLGLPLPVRVVT